MLREVKLSELELTNALMKGRTSDYLEDSVHKGQPYQWFWQADVRPDGSVKVSLEEECLSTMTRLEKVVAVFSSDQLVAELKAHWRRPTFAHITAEGMLRRQVDKLRHDLEEVYALEQKRLEQEACAGSGLFPSHHVAPPEGLLRQSIWHEATGTTVNAVRTGRFSTTVMEIAWGLAILACLRQANQYALPYGGQVFDVGQMLREATRDPE